MTNLRLGIAMLVTLSLLTCVTSPSYAQEVPLIIVAPNTVTGELILNANTALIPYAIVAPLFVVRGTN